MMVAIGCGRGPMAEKGKERIADGRWLIAATVGLALCIAGTEYERYTALWVFETRSPAELASIILFIAVVLAVLVNRTLNRQKRFYRNKPFLIALALVQTMGLAGRCMQATGFTLSEPIAVAVSVSMHCASILFVVYAEFFLDVGVRKAVSAFAFGIAGAGVLQIIVLGLDWQIAAGMLFLFVPGSVALLMWSDLHYQDIAREVEREDIAAEVRDSEGFARDYPFWEYCISIALLEVLLIALHSTVMVTQDRGDASFVIQMTSGVGTLLAGALFYALLRYLQETEFLELFRILVLPLVLVALYVSALFGASGVPLYLIPLAVAYSILLLFVWTVPRNYRKGNAPFVFTCIAYLSYRAGWALGVYGIMILPDRYGDLLSTGIVLAVFSILLVSSAVRLLQFRRNSAQRLNKAKEAVDLQANTDIAFAEACSRVANRYQLTPREGEVLVLLARGRNARHIAEALIISDGTARTHIMHIYQKMELNSQQVLMDIVDDELRKVMDDNTNLPSLSARTDFR